MTPPKDPNQLPLDFRLDKVYGDQLEVEHDHKLCGQDGRRSRAGLSEPGEHGPLRRRDRGVRDRSSEQRRKLRVEVSLRVDQRWELPIFASCDEAM